MSVIDQIMKANKGHYGDNAIPVMIPFNLLSDIMDACDERSVMLNNNLQENIDEVAKGNKPTMTNLMVDNWTERRDELQRFANRLRDIIET